MNIEKMREDFEAWYLENYCGGTERLKKCTNDDSSYYYCGVQAMWTPWQASRESLVIELPKIREIDESMDCIDSAEFAISECRAAIESEGIKVKS